MTPQMLSYQDEHEREHCAKGKKITDLSAILNLNYKI